MSGAGKKRISQETFDDAVRENMATFGADLAEALADAVQQFEATGICLDNIIKDGSTLNSSSKEDDGAAKPVARHPVLAALDAVGEFNRKLQMEPYIPDKDYAADFESVASGLSSLADACSTAEHRAIAGSNVAVPQVLTAIQSALLMREKHKDAADLVLKNAWIALRNICTGNDENKARVPTRALEMCMQCMKPEGSATLQSAALLCAALLCVRREDVKVYLFEHHAPRMIFHNLKDDASRLNSTIVKDTCILLSRMLTDDDYSVQASKAYQYAREVAAEGIIQQLLTAVTTHQSELSTVSEVFSAIKCVTVNDEICKEIERLGGVEIVTTCLTEYLRDDLTSAEAAPKTDTAAVTAAAAEAVSAKTARLLRCGMSVLRAVANSDAIKVKMCDGDAKPMRLMLDTLAVFRAVPAVMEQAVAAVGNLCLRLQGNCEKIVAAGGIRLIADAMRLNPDSAGVQRSGCLALRNIVVRSPARVAAAFDEGCEPLLQKAYLNHMVCRDVAYACLRDMGCSYAETVTGREAAERAQRAAEVGDISVK